MLSSSTLSAEVVLLGGVSMIALGLVLLLTGRRRVRHGKKTVLAVLLVLLGFGSLQGWAAWQDASTPEWTGEEIPKAVPPPLKPPPWTATTDRGRLVTLHVSASSDPAHCSELDEADYLQRADLTRKVNRTGTPTVDTNCHGWVFTGGRYWVKGEAVQSIL